MTLFAETELIFSFHVQMSLLSYVFTSVILSAFQCAVMCASAYPYGANLPAILEALHDLLCAPPSETTAAEVAGPVTMVQQGPTPAAPPAPASVAAQPTQPVSVTSELAVAPRVASLPFVSSYHIAAFLTGVSPGVAFPSRYCSICVFVHQDAASEFPVGFLWW